MPAASSAGTVGHHPPAARPGARRASTSDRRPGNRWRRNCGGHRARSRLARHARLASSHREAAGVSEAGTASLPRVHVQPAQPDSDGRGRKARRQRRHGLVAAAPRPRRIGGPVGGGVSPTPCRPGEARPGRLRDDPSAAHRSHGSAPVDPQKAPPGSFRPPAAPTSVLSTSTSAEPSSHLRLGRAVAAGAGVPENRDAADTASASRLRSPHAQAELTAGQTYGDHENRS
jgi:hypothetical protein